jgi:cytochrome c-type biogenesis protein CcmH
LFPKASLIAILVFLSAHQVVLASIDAKEFSSEENRAVYLDLTRELRCPKCQNQDIADSNAPIAQDMRAQVHILVEEGKTHEQVVDYMIERFGEFVSYRPRVTTETYLLWYGPWVLIGLGALVVFLLSQRKGAAAPSTEEVSAGLVSSASPRARSEGVAMHDSKADARVAKQSKIADLVNKYDE